MQYVQPYDQPSNPNAPYVNGNPSAGIQGSIIPAGAVENPQREIVSVITLAGLTPNGSDLTQVAQAIQAGQFNFAVAGGTANALTATLTPAPVALMVGMEVDLQIATANTGSVTLNLNGFGALPIKTLRGGALSKGDLPPGSIIKLKYAGTAWLFVGIAYSEVPLFPAAGTTIYVRPDGNDSNDGSANDAGHAFVTISGAINYIKQKYVLSSGGVGIKLGVPGTYASPGIVTGYAGTINIVGDASAQANYVISGAGAGAMIGGAGGASLGFSGVTLLNNNTSAHTTSFTSGSVGSFGFVTFQASGSNTTQSHVFVSSGATANIGTGIVIASGCGFCWQATSGSIVFSTGTITFNGTPSFAQAVAYATMGGTITCQPTTAMSGSATGARYTATLNGIINSSGQGANYFPGSVAGTTSTGGQYA
ncbi:hypothetical protein FBZ99_101298 [Rhizobium sp. ERR 1071]|uniref:hypothetical protein n=1 Tax=Rhizobium sp. ERR 1071 TaxID=2572677 RepID=UPI00119B00D7|nr:hypothetical protein [Rhizobium sp. ERR1071]TWB19525.1 hypothetical protein FBZ99_101298 [Rhizobium sp. ERR1071]